MNDSASIDLSQEGRDAIAVQYEGIARVVASRVCERFRAADWDDVHSAAWMGVLEGARTFDPERGGTLPNHLFCYAFSRGLRYARSESRRGIRGPRGPRVPDARGRPQLTAIENEELIPERPPRAAEWAPADWAAAVATLNAEGQRLVLAVYRDEVPQTELSPQYGPTRAAVAMRLTKLRRELAASPVLRDYLGAAQ